MFFLDSWSQCKLLTFITSWLEGQGVLIKTPQSRTCMVIKLKMGREKKNIHQFFLGEEHLIFYTQCKIITLQAFSYIGHSEHAFFYAET